MNGLRDFPSMLEKILDGTDLQTAHCEQSFIYEAVSMTD